MIMGCHDAESHSNISEEALTAKRVDFFLNSDAMDLFGHITDTTKLVHERENFTAKQF